MTKLCSSPRSSVLYSLSLNLNGNAYFAMSWNCSFEWILGFVIRHQLICFRFQDFCMCSDFYESAVNRCLPVFQWCVREKAFENSSYVILRCSVREVAVVFLVVVTTVEAARELCFLAEVVAEEGFVGLRLIHRLLCNSSFYCSLYRNGW